MQPDSSPETRSGTSSTRSFYFQWETFEPYARFNTNWKPSQIPWYMQIHSISSWNHAYSVEQLKHWCTVHPFFGSLNFHGPPANNPFAFLAQLGYTFSRLTLRTVEALLSDDKQRYDRVKYIKSFLAREKHVAEANFWFGHHGGGFNQ